MACDMSTFSPNVTTEWPAIPKPSPQDDPTSLNSHASQDILNLSQCHHQVAWLLKTISWATTKTGKTKI